MRCRVKGLDLHGPSPSVHRARATRQHRSDQLAHDVIAASQDRPQHRLEALGLVRTNPNRRGSPPRPVDSAPRRHAIACQPHAR